MALSLATALSLMQSLKVPHPPAGSNPFIVFPVGANWDFLVTPTLVGSAMLVLVALFYNNLSKDRKSIFNKMFPCVPKLRLGTNYIYTG